MATKKMIFMHLVGHKVLLCCFSNPHRFMEMFGRTDSNQHEIEQWSLQARVSKCIWMSRVVCVCSVAENETENKMSLQNLATVFGPTVLRPAVKGSEVQTMEELFSSGTRDAMMQTSILMTFLNLRKKGAQFWIGSTCMVTTYLERLVMLGNVSRKSGKFLGHNLLITKLFVGNLTFGAIAVFSWVYSLRTGPWD